MIKLFILTIAVLSFSIVTIEAQNLVAHYPFNGDANDISGNAYHGSVVNAILGADRYQAASKCYYFDGDMITFNENFDFPEKTISFWFKAFNIPASGDKVIISIDNNNLTNSQFGIDVRSQNQLHFSVGNSGGSTPISTNIWYHTVLIMSSTQYKLYINGALVSLGSYSSFHSASGNNGMTIGASRMRNAAFFNGAVDEIKIFNNALSDADAINLYTQYLVINDQVVKTSETFTNPFTDKLHIYSPEKNFSVRMYNIHGEIVYKGNDNFTINTTNFTKGVYFIHLISEDGILIKQQKLLKM